MVGSTGAPLHLGQYLLVHTQTLRVPVDRALTGRTLAYPSGMGPEELLPEQTSDDIDTEEARERDDRDAWLRDQVPPHHG